MSLSHRSIKKGLCVLFTSLTVPALADYSGNELALDFINEVVADEGFNRSELIELFSQAERKQSIIDAMDRPAEKTLTWGEYRKIFLRNSRIHNGVAFWEKNRTVLAAAEARFGIPAQYIVAIIGVETFYGRNTGSYRVLDALATLAFNYPKRAPFFRSELKHFLLLARDQGRNPLELNGSYAGAMGLGQFMPSSYRAYAVGYEEDGFIDIWTDPNDAIWSVANYLAQHGWQAGEPVAARAVVADNHDSEFINQGLKPNHSFSELASVGITSSQSGIRADGPATAMRLEGDRGAEYWIGAYNFYVITRYNHSRLYAMAVFQLAEEILALASQLRQ